VALDVMPHSCEDEPLMPIEKEVPGGLHVASAHLGEPRLVHSHLRAAEAKLRARHHGVNQIAFWLLVSRSRHRIAGMTAVLVLDRNSGQALYRAIVWQDRRTAARCARLAASPAGARIRKRTGLVLDPYFSATKIEWLQEHVPGLRRRVRDGDAVFGTIDTWLLFRLTNGATFATDPTHASPTMRYDTDAPACSA